MNDTMQAQDEYRRQIARFAQLLSVARNDPLAADLAPSQALWQVKLFTDGNLDKRYQKLLDQLERLESVFDDLDDLIVTFVRTVPLAAYDTGASDGERFLQWIANQRPLTAEQQDFVLCERSRYAIECLARRNRLGHVRFQELLSAAKRLVGELETNPGLRIHLNPIRLWSEFQTPALLDEDTELPVSVLFYAVDQSIRTAVLETDGELLVRHLEAAGPCSLEEWSTRAGEIRRGELIELAHDLVDLGLLALV